MEKTLSILVDEERGHCNSELSSHMPFYIYYPDLVNHWPKGAVTVLRATEDTGLGLLSP